MRSWPSPDLPRLSATGPEVALHDTSTDALVTTRPDGPARMYVCGITPYDATHIGHAATYVAFDLLHRAWRNAGHEVTYVQNVTDVDDPLLERATKVGVDWVELAERETELFRQDMTALRVVPPAHYVGAVESIALVVELIAAAAGLPAPSTRWRTTSTSRSPATRRSARSPGCPARRCCGCSPSAAATPSARARRTLSTASCGAASGRASLPGRVRSAAAARAGTSSAPRSPSTCSGRPSTSRPGEPT